MAITSGLFSTVYGNSIALLKGTTSSSVFTTYLGIPGEIIVDISPIFSEISIKTGGLEKIENRMLRKNKFSRGKGLVFIEKIGIFKDC